MNNQKKTEKPTFTKASTPEGLSRQRAAIRDYYIKKRQERSSAKSGKPTKK